MRQAAQQLSRSLQSQQKDKIGERRLLFLKQLADIA